MKKRAVVIIPTTGAETLRDVIESLDKQTYVRVEPLIVIDGPQFFVRTMNIIADSDLSDSFRYLINCNVITLPENVGSGGFYGQRIYSACAYLVNQDYIFLLDQDNWFEPNHIESMIDKLESTKCDWVYSLRNIYSKDGEYLLKDDCESLGRWNPFVDYKIVDNNCYCFTKEALLKIAPLLYGGWGQDRVLYQGLEQHIPNFCCTGLYTVNYRLDGNPNSVKKEFFEYGNNIVQQKFNGNILPWRV